MVRLVRAICIDGDRVEPGTVHVFDRATAAELVHSGKAELIVSATATPRSAGPVAAPTPAPAEVPVAGDSAADPRARPKAAKEKEPPHAEQ